MSDNLKIPLLLDRYIDAILRHRWLVLVIATLIMLVMTGGVRFIGVTNDYRSLFDEEIRNLPRLMPWKPLTPNPIRR